MSPHPGWPGAPARRPLLALAAVALGLAIAIAGLVDGDGRFTLRVDPGLDELLPRDDADRREYDDLRLRFGGDDWLWLAARVGDPFAESTRDRMTDLTARLQALEPVRRVVSPDNAPTVRRIDGRLGIEPLVSRAPRDRAEAEHWLDDRLHAGVLLSRSGDVAAWLVELEPWPEARLIESGVDLEVGRLAREVLGVDEVWVAGAPAITAAMSRILQHDLATQAPVLLGLMAVFSWLVFRSAAAASAPIVTIAVALVWTLGAMGWMGRSLDVVTSLIPPLILAIGFAYAIHGVSAAVTGSVDGEGPDRRRRIADAFARVALPVALTAATTAIGFLSLGLSRIEVIRGFGVCAAIGVLACWLATAVVTPAWLAAWSAGARAHRPGRPDRLAPLARSWARSMVGHRRWVLGATALVAVVCAVGASRVRVDTEIVEAFESDAPVRLGFEAINRHMDGASSFHVVVGAERDGGLREPEALAEIASLQRWLADQPEVGGSTSVVDHLVAYRAALVGERDALPASRAEIAQLLFLAGGDEVERLLDASGTRAAVVVRSRSARSSELEELVARIDDRLDRLPDGLDGRVTGNAILLTRAADEISRGQVRSLAGAFFAIATVLVVYFRSVRVGLVALLPNALPVLVYFGALGWAGIPLNNATALMGCIVLGIAVDDTIHWLVHFRRRVRAGLAAAEAAAEALASVARPITHTSLVLCLGLAFVATSELRTQSQFGWMGAFTLAAAWWIDATLTPALCSLLPRRWLGSAESDAAPDTIPLPGRASEAA